MKKQFFSKEASLNEEGYLEAIFSVFDVEDRDGDVVKSSAIKNGVAIPLVWHHDWSRPIGKGTITNDGTKAIFKGNFFLDTTEGMEAYKTVKNMGDLQQYSWGFAILNQEKGTLGDKTVNYITATEAFEVSPVLVGANQHTSTVDIKEAKMYVDATVPGSYESRKHELCEAFRKQQLSNGEGYATVVATFDDHFIGMIYKWTDEEESYWDVSYEIKDNQFVLGTPVQVEAQTEFIPVQATGTNMTYNAHSDFVQVALAELVQRSKAGSALRSKDGRQISETRLAELKTLVESLTNASKSLQEIIDSSSTTEYIDGTELFLEFAQIIARQNGVTL